jgi:ribosomal protein L7/L12
VDRDLNDAERDGVLNHLRAGEMIQAIKAYREATGAGLKEAKDACEAMALQTPWSVAASGNLNKSERDEIARFLAAGQKIQAIKVYREATGVGLKEAKDAVEAMESQQSRSGSSPIAAKADGGCFTMILLAISLVTGGVAVVRYWL